MIFGLCLSAQLFSPQSPQPTPTTVVLSLLALPLFSPCPLPPAVSSLSSCVARSRCLRPPPQLSPPVHGESLSRQPAAHNLSSNLPATPTTTPVVTALPTVHPAALPRPCQLLVLLPSCQTRAAFSSLAPSEFSVSPMFEVSLPIHIRLPGLWRTG